MLSLLTFSLINDGATRLFPLTIFVLHIVIMAITVGDDTCDETNVKTFMVYWLIMLGACAVTAMYVEWNTLHKDTGVVRKGLAIVLAVIVSCAYFAGITLMRGTPFHCLDNGELIVHAIGPVILWIVYFLVTVYSATAFTSSSDEVRDEYIRLESAKVEKGETEISQVRFLELRAQALFFDVRRKFPLLGLLLSYTVVSVFIGDGGCESVNHIWSAVFLGCVLGGQFCMRYVRVRQYTFADASELEKRINATFEGLLSSILLFGLMANREMPMICFGEGAKLLVYTWSPVIILGSIVIGFVSSYLLLRNMYPDQLVRFARGYSTKFD